MADLNHSDIAELVRRRFNGPEGDELRYIPLVDSALRQLAYDVAKDPQLRNYLMTDRATTVATLDADGVADLATLVTTSPRILLECLEYGEVFPPDTGGYPTQPFRIIDNEGQFQLQGAYDSLVLKAHVHGFNFETRSADGNVTPVAGDISFKVPYWPTIAQLPNALVQKLVWGPYWQETPLTEAKNAAA